MISTGQSWEQRFSNNCVFYAPQDLIRAAFEPDFNYPSPIEKFDRFQETKTLGRGVMEPAVLETIDGLLEETNYQVEMVLLDPVSLEAWRNHGQQQAEQTATDGRVKLVRKVNLVDHLPCLMYFGGAKDGGDSHFACVTREETLTRLASHFSYVDMVIKIGEKESA